MKGKAYKYLMQACCLEKLQSILYCASLQISWMSSKYRCGVSFQLNPILLLPSSGNTCVGDCINHLWRTTRGDGPGGCHWRQAGTVGSGQMDISATAENRHARHRCVQPRDGERPPLPREGGRLAVRRRPGGQAS